MLGKILILVPGFPSSPRDTTCLPAVQNYVRALARVHPNIEVVALQYPFRPGRYMWHGIPVYAAAGSNLGGFEKLRTWRRAWHALRAAPADLIHSFWIGECALLGALATRGVRGAHVASIGGRELLYPTIYSRILRRARLLLVAGSKHAADAAKRTLRRPVDSVIPLGLDVENFDRADIQRTIDVLGVGSLIETKRFSDVIQVARTLQEARFVIVGDGPLRSALVESAPSNVRFTGHIDRSSVIGLMQQSKVLLHPSPFESQGYVFLEALASGMHVVCRDIGAPGDSSNVHRRNTLTEMAETVSRLLTDVHSFPAIPVPSADESARAYMDLYERAVAGR